MTKLFGIPVDTLLVVLVFALALALGVIGVLALRHPILVKLGVRNVGRFSLATFKPPARAPRGTG